MRRRRAVAGVCALAAVLLTAAPGALSAAAPGAPAVRATDCTWHKHSRRVVRHVRRHGKVQRIVRHRHWWTCDPVIAPGPARLSVRAFEYGYLLSRPSVASGELILEFDNQGEDSHNLSIAPEGSADPPLVHYAETPSLERASQRFSLAPGTYRLWCDLPEHDSRGMHSTLTVTSG